MKVRAKDKDGTLRYGWYIGCCDIEGTMTHFMVPDTAIPLWKKDNFNVISYIAIDIATAAVETGKLDKHGQMIYGSEEPYMQGGDRVSVSTRQGILIGVFHVAWNRHVLGWCLNDVGRGTFLLSHWPLGILEIAPPEDK